MEDRLADRDLSVTEREVLRVLLSHSDRYLRRGEIQKLLSFVRTPARISQILTSLDHQNLLVRMQGRAQGNPEASFFALSPRGFKVCRNLGLDRRRMPYFRLEEASWKEHLTPERIAVREGEALEPGKVAAVWSYRGGVGRSTAIAQAALPLAERMRKAQAGRLLVIDLDLESPGLDAHLAPGGLGECRGLRGLIVDFYKLPPSERPKWLREALLAPGYVLRSLKVTLNAQEMVAFMVENGSRAPISESATLSIPEDALDDLVGEAEERRASIVKSSEELNLYDCVLFDGRKVSAVARTHRR